MGENIHKGHRKRLKNEFISGGFNENTPAHKWIELLLFFCIQRSDTNPLAHELIDKYKTISGVLNAPVSELLEFNGLTENNVALLKMIIPIARQCELEKCDDLSRITTPTQINDLIVRKFYGLSNEQFGIACLDAVGNIIDFKFLGQGDVSEVGISARSVVKFALDCDANIVIIAHNHPKSFALPSKADIDATVFICETLKKVNVKLIDHLIISGGDYVSMSQSRDYSYIFM